MAQFNELTVEERLKIFEKFVGEFGRINSDLAFSIELLQQNARAILKDSNEDTVSSFESHLERTNLRMGEFQNLLVDIGGDAVEKLIK